MTLLVAHILLGCGSSTDDSPTEGGTGGTTSGPGEWVCGELDASHYRAAEGCFDAPQSLPEVCVRELYPNGPSASVGTSCLLSPEGALYVVTLGSSKDLQAPEGWKYPDWNGADFRTYDGWSQDETAQCHAALGDEPPVFAPFEPACP